MEKVHLNGKIQRYALRIILLFGALLVALSASAQLIRPSIDDGGRQTLQNALDKVRIEIGSPGASAAIFQDGSLLWQGSSGLAEVHDGIPVETDTLYALASVTKMFVATMTLRLYEEGKLGLDDFIAGYVPGYIPDVDRVTIRELLGHTSGYPDIYSNNQIDEWLLDPNHEWTQESLFERIQPVVFQPGKHFMYSNTNYLLLGAVIARASGSTVGKEFERLIRTPIPLPDAYFKREGRVAHRFAHGYNLQGKWLVDTFKGAHRLGVPTCDWGTIWTDGGIGATAGAVAKFSDALFGGHILQPATLAAMMTPGPDGSYGLGVFQYNYDGHSWEGHDGSFNGFESQSGYDFTRNLTIVVLTNLTDNGNTAQPIWNRMVYTFDRLP
jgi:D-alanyl-D-alanine carboxypeptidase